VKLVASATVVAALAFVVPAAGTDVPLLVVAVGGAASSRELAMSADGSVHLLTHNRIPDEHPTWSPDGRLIAFVRRGTRRGGIYLLRLPRTIVRLTHGPSDDAPAFAPDGKKIAFVRDSRILVMRDDGRQPQVVASAAGPPRQLSWSPDGRRILYGDLGLVRMVDVDTHAVTTLLVGGDDDNFRPTHSPDGTQIAFLSYRDERYFRDPDAWGIWIANADGSGVHRVAVGKYGPMSWSADGQIVARFGYELALFDSATGTKTELTLRGSWAEFLPP
jgi:Tol biopolymer transport system component